MLLITFKVTMAGLGAGPRQSRRRDHLRDLQPCRLVSEGSKGLRVGRGDSAEFYRLTNGVHAGAHLAAVSNLGLSVSRTRHGSQ